MFDPRRPSKNRRDPATRATPKPAPPPPAEGRARGGSSFCADGPERSRDRHLPGPPVVALDARLPSRGRLRRGRRRRDHPPRQRQLGLRGCRVRGDPRDLAADRPLPPGLDALRDHRPAAAHPPRHPRRAPSSTPRSTGSRTSRRARRCSSGCCGSARSTSTRRRPTTPTSPSSASRPPRLVVAAVDRAQQLARAPARTRSSSHDGPGGRTRRAAGARSPRARPAAPVPAVRA